MKTSSLAATLRQQLARRQRQVEKIGREIATLNDALATLHTREQRATATAKRRRGRKAGK